MNQGLVRSCESKTGLDEIIYKLKLRKTAKLHARNYCIYHMKLIYIIYIIYILGTGKQC